MTILITAASGQLGRLVVDALLQRGAAPSDVVTTARNASKIADLGARGVRTAELDYDRPETITAALAGVDSVLLVSGSVPGARLQGHRNVIDAAKSAGVTKFVYTSLPKATTEEFSLTPDHRATEHHLTESGLPAVILRNNWYSENYADIVARAADTGVVESSAGDGKVAGASRADYADATAAVLLEDGHIGNVYELGGDIAWGFDDLAAAASEILGAPVTYSRLTYEEHLEALNAAGLDADTAAFVAGIDAGIRRGVLGSTDGTLARLIGRPTTPLVDALRAAVETRNAAN